ncbi:hypothetical protein GCM10009080_34980 [Cupriavidus pauculus]
MENTLSPLHLPRVTYTEGEAAMHITRRNGVDYFRRPSDIKRRTASPASYGAVRARAFLRGPSCFEKYPEADRPDAPTVAPGCSSPSGEQRRRYCSLSACGVAVAERTKRTDMAFAH